MFFSIYLKNFIQNLDSFSKRSISKNFSIQIQTIKCYETWPNVVTRFQPSDIKPIGSFARWEWKIYQKFSIFTVHLESQPLPLPSATY